MQLGESFGYWVFRLVFVLPSPPVQEGGRVHPIGIVRLVGLVGSEPFHDRFGLSPNFAIGFSGG